MISESDYFANAGKQKLYSDANTDPGSFSGGNTGDTSNPYWQNGSFGQDYASRLSSHQKKIDTYNTARNSDDYKLIQSQYQAALNRETNLGLINQAEKARNPYYSSLYESMNKAQEGGIEQNYADTMKRMQLQHAGRGTLGGSQQIYNSGQIGAAKALQTAQARQQSQNYVQGLRQQDQARFGQLRQNVFAGDPYQQQFAQSLTASNQLRGGMYNPYAQSQIAGLQANQQYQNDMSQISGQALGLAGQGAQIGAMYV